MTLDRTTQGDDGVLTAADIGKMFTVPWSPNPHRLEAIRPRHCQMHGEYIGEEAVFRKRRNSEVRQWGGLSVVMVDMPGIAALNTTGGSNDR